MFMKHGIMASVFIREAAVCGLASLGKRNGNSAPGARFRLAVFSAVLAALAAFSAVPPDASAQTPPRCRSTPAVTGTPSATPSVWTFDGSYTTKIDCDRLANGIMLTVGPDAEVGTEAAPITEVAIVVDAEDSGDNPVTFVNSGAIHSDASGGIEIDRDGAGALKIEHKAGKIVGAGTVSTGIYAAHRGKKDTVTGGIHLVSSADIDLSKSTNNTQNGIQVTTDAGPGATIPITVELKGGTIITGKSTSGRGIRVTQYAKGDITITTAPDAVIGKKGTDNAMTISAVLGRTTSVGNVVITHRGKLYGSGRGIWVTNSSPSPEEGDVTVTVTEEGEIRTSTNRGMEIGVYNTASTGDIKIIHNGTLSSKFEGIFALQNGKGDVTVETGKTGKVVTTSTTGMIGRLVLYGIGIDVSLRGSDREGDLTVIHRGEITAREEGIVAVIGGSLYSYLNNPSDRDADSGGTIKVATAEGSKVAGGKDGIFIWHNGGGAAGRGMFDVAVRGTVTGGGDSYAGIRIAAKGDVKGNGGVIAIGPRGHVSAESGTAIEAEKNAGPVAVILEKDEDGLVGWLKGKILHPAAVTFKTRTGEDAGTETTLSAGDTVDRRGETKGVYDEVFRDRLTKITGGHEFQVQSQTRFYRDRARLYEALPSVLLDLNARPGVGAGMCEGGARAEVFMSDGERMAGSSTTAAGWRKQALGWDMKRKVLEAGYDFPADGSLCVGFSAGRRTVEADVMRGGGVKAEATGGAVTLGWRPDSGVDVSWRLSYSRLHDIELSPAGGGAVIAAPGGGGVSVSVAAGKRMEFQGMQVTPRAGFEFSSVETGGFTEPAALDGAGEVSDVRAGSLKGTLGARIDMAAGEAGTLWAAADVEHDFKSGTDITVTGAVLKAEMKPTWGRLGLGGEFRLSDMMTLSGGAYYAAGGGGNKDLGGSLALNVSF